MVRGLVSRWFGKRPTPTLRRRNPSRLQIEPLEDRLLLDALPPALVVGRTLSSYTTVGVQNNQETITFTVYNEQADDETGVLLTDTLQPGVQFQTATQLPDQNGQQLAWSLGTIHGFDRASVTMTVSFTGPIPTQLDTGTAAFATLDAGAVSNTTPAATLRTTAIAANLLASTPDANTTDPYIQEQAAKLNYDPVQIFKFLHTQIGYNSYTGSLRGARGTLWSDAGNALDVASLGVALMRASGIPAQYEAGMLSQAQAQQLILSMFPATFQTTGYVPAGAPLADPANDPQLLAETENHYWFQFDPGTGLTDADPLMAGATIGQVFTASTGMFTEVPDNLREKAEIQLTAETYSQASAAFGLGNGLSQTIVLDQSFNDVDLVGHPLTIGNFVSSASTGLTVTRTVNTYEPYLGVGDDANPDPSQTEIIHGQSYQEVFTNLALGNEVVTGLFLNITLTGPAGAAQTYQKALVDRIGYDVRQNGGGPAITIDPNTPTINSAQVWSLAVLAGLQNPTAPITLEDHLFTDYTNLWTQVSASQSTLGSSDLTQVLVGQAQAYLTGILATSDVYTNTLATAAQVVAYSDRPRLTVVSGAFTLSDTQAPVLSFEADLLRDSIRALAFPGQAASVVAPFQTARGFLEDEVESEVFPNVTSSDSLQLQFHVSASTVVDAANAQGIPLVTITPDEPAVVGALAIDSVAKARILSALQAGFTIITPSEDVSIGDQPTIAWFQLNPQTGEIAGVGDDGAHQSLAEYGLSAQILKLAKGNDKLLAALGTSAAVKTWGHLRMFFPVNALNFLLAITHNDPEHNAVPGDLANAKQLALAQLNIDVDNAIKRVYSATAVPKAFQDAFRDKLVLLLIDFQSAVHNKSVDPSIVPLLSGVPHSFFHFTVNALDVGNQSIQPAGSVTGSLATQSLSVTGPLDASWGASATSSFYARNLSSTAASITNAAGTPVGSGTVAVASLKTTPLLISGVDSYTVNGQGKLSFYGPAESSLGVSADWDNYSAMVTGTVTISLTTDALTLNGQMLPAGTYRITTSSVTLNGSGQTTSPSFAGSATATITGGTVYLGPSSSGATLGGHPLDLTSGAAQTGYTGSIAVAVGGRNTDSVTLNGSAANFLAVSATPATVTTDQNTPVTFQANVNTSFADTYDLRAEVPPGWTASIDTTGKITVTPAPGAQSGTFPVQIIVQSPTDADLVAQATVNVTITPTLPGIALAVNPDSVLSVPFNGAEVPSAFQASIQNTGPSTDSFRLTFPTLPNGFTILRSGSDVTVPAGQTGILGFYLQPSGSQLAAPGTQVTFSVQATSNTNPAITKTQPVTFTVPNIDGIALSGNPTQVSTTPGAPTTDMLTITNVGNVPETIALTSTQSTGLTVTGLNAVTLNPNQSQQETVTVTADASTPLNSVLQATITATFGPTAAPVTQTLQLPVDVVVPGALAIANAANSAAQVGNSNLADRLNDLSTAITNFVQGAFTNGVNLSQVLAALDAVISLANADPILAPTTPPLSAARTELATATTTATYTTAIKDLGTSLTDFANVLLHEVAHNVSLNLTPSSAAPVLNAAVPFNLSIQNTGSQATTYDLSLAGLPANATAVFSQNGQTITKVTLQPGQVISGGGDGMTVSVTETGDSLLAGTFTVTATAEGATEITHDTQGTLTLPDTSIAVAEVDATPPFTNPSPTNTVDVTAKLAATVNSAQLDQGFYTVADSTGKVVFTSTPVAVTLAAPGGFKAFDLGSFNTTGLANGFYTITVTITDASGNPLSGVTGTGTVQIGLPLSGSSGLETDLTRTIAGITTTVSSTFPFDSPNGAIDNNLNTAWFSRNGDAVNQGGAPFYEVDFPSAVVVNRVELYGPRGSDPRIQPANALTGHVTLFDAKGAVLFDTGTISLNVGTLLDGVASFADVANVSKVRFTPTTDVGTDVGLAEFKVLGPLQNLSAGTVSVTTPLDLKAQIPLASPLTLLGSVATTPTARSVTVYALPNMPGTTLAYLPGNTSIDIVNVSKPAAPVDLGAFGSGDIAGGGLALARIATIGGQDYLVVASSVALNATGFSLLIYSLANPLAPTLVSKTTLNDGGLFSDMLIDGTTLLLPTQYITVFGVFGDQGGTVAAIDISKPAAPVNEGLLFNDKTAAFGGGLTGDTNQIGGALVNSNLAYIGSSTSVGSKPAVGVGRMLLVDTSNPSKLQLTGSMELDVPGTVHIIAVALDPTDHRALLVGTTGGWTSISASNTNGLGGTVTLSTVDTTDPLHPVLLGTVTTSFLPHFTAFSDDHGAPGIVYLGNNLFAVAGEDSTTNSPVLLIVDITSPTNPIVASVPLPAMNYELAVNNGDLYVSSTNGLSIYQINALPSIAYTAAIEVPKGSVVANSLSLASATLDTSNPNFDVVNLQGSLTNGTTTARLSFQSQLDDVNFSEVVPVTLGTTVNFVSQGTSGRFTLPGTNLPAFHIISLNPPSQPGQVGTASSYIVHLTNPTNNDATYSLMVQGVPATWVNLPDSVFVPANGARDVALQLAPDSTAKVGVNGFAVTADNGSGLRESAPGALMFSAPTPVPVDPDSHGIVVTLTPATASAGQGTSAVYTVQLTNTGSGDDTFALAATVPSGVTATFSQTSVDVPPGASNFRDVTLTLTPTKGTAAGNDPFTVTATSTSKASVTGSAPGKLTVLGNGVSVALDRSSGAPGSTFQLTVTNTGNVQDTFDLTLAAPAALVATLGQSAVTLAAGASQTITITTTAVNFADSGTLALMATATSHSNAAVHSSATADLAIPQMQGLTAQLSPATQTLPAPGPAMFLAQVNNTGNTEDAYTATITGTTGAVTAYLVGLDGQPTQTIPVFRLPGLAAGALQLQTAATDSAGGTVTLKVTSLNDPARSQLLTAMVTTTVTQTSIATNFLNGVVFGQAVTFTATVSATAGTPTGSVEFFANGNDIGPGSALSGSGDSATSTLTIATLPLGTDGIKAVYTPTGVFQTSTGTGTQVVSAVATSVSVATSAALAPAGSNITFTATVQNLNTAATPAGHVEFFADGSDLGPGSALIGSGATATATLTHAALLPGSHTILAVFTPTGAFLASNGSVAQVVNSAPVIDLPSPQTIHRNLPVRLSFAVSDSAVTAGSLQVTLSIDHGTFRLASAPGLDKVTGNNSSTLTLTGSQNAINNALAILTYVPRFLYLGMADLTLSVNDLGDGGGTPQVTTSSAVLRITDRPPTLALQSLHGLHYHFRFNAPLSVTAKKADLQRGFADPELDPLQIFLIRKPKHGTFHIQRNGAFVYTPKRGFHGTDQILVHAFDGVYYSPNLVVLFGVGNPPKGGGRKK